MKIKKKKVNLFIHDNNKDGPLGNLLLISSSSSFFE
jgi:hypothetical protein